MNTRPEQMPEGMPNVTDFRNMMLQNLSYDDIKGVCAWLGLEGVKAQSDEIFMLGKTLATIADDYHGRSARL